MSAKEESAYYYLRSFLKTPSGELRAVGVGPDYNKGEILPVKTGFNIAWKVTTNEGSHRKEYVLSLKDDRYTVYPGAPGSQVVAVFTEPRPSYFWYRTDERIPPGSDEWGTIWELPRETNQVWTVYDPSDPESIIVLKPLDTSSGKISDAQLFKLVVPGPHH